MPRSRYDAIVIGGGFFGCSLALHLKRVAGGGIALLEMGNELMGRASFANQARVHGGYHYPRSLVTGARSQANYQRFIDEFRPCIDETFTSVYAIGRVSSNITAAQFHAFCRRIGAPVEPAPAPIGRLFDPERIEAVFTVRECAFNAAALRCAFERSLMAAGVDVLCAVEARQVSQGGAGLVLSCLQAGVEKELTAREVFNCTYARMNKLLADSSLPLIPLVHELAEIALVEPPEALARCAVTIMCGPYFSLMPFPARGVHSLSHVRYTPHRQWQTCGAAANDAYQAAAPRPPSNFPHMIRDAQRYLPVMRDCRHVDSLWEVKAILPQSSGDDSRPILVSRNHGLPNLTCMAGAKLDNIYDALGVLEPAAGRWSVQ